ncbi:hypothetical protein BGZ95_010663 [Linnemannia exigua]|uniref:Cas12f1-like TNB domain-containing protein n=1 Tax=Linnemannia exigua TaxID=604196 RepID=A0AAD4DB79_9FUNG|nr:hypothetical protein BGZ95_010663 [Linnemannia exigua]
MSFFVRLARSLGYIVVGVNEFYTSKKCPTCGEFDAQVNLRRLYCPTCQAFMHRDIMAGHNMCDIVMTHLLAQARPLYLQPVDDDGHYPWMEVGESKRIDTISSSSLSSKDKVKAEQPAKDVKPTFGPTQRIGKRKSTGDSMSRDSPVQGDTKCKAATDSRPRVNQPENKLMTRLWTRVSR